MKFKFQRDDEEGLIIVSVTLDNKYELNLFRYGNLDQPCLMPLLPHTDFLFHIHLKKQPAHPE